MQPLKPELLVSTATALASWEYQRKAAEAEHDRALADAKRGDASLRFVHFAGFWSHFDHGIRLSSWPLTRSAGVTTLSDVVEQNHGLESSPTAGDVFLLASHRRNRHVRAGIVAAVETVGTMVDGSAEFVCTTIEGEFGPARPDAGAVRIPVVRLVRRRLSRAFGDSFIRWCNLPPQAWPATLEYAVPHNLPILDQDSDRRAT